MSDPGGIINTSLIGHAEAALSVPFTMEELEDLLHYCKEKGIVPATLIRGLVRQELVR